MEKHAYKDRFSKEDSHWWFIARQAYLMSYLAGAKKRRYAILDIGCGTGGTSMFLKNFGEVTGVENSQEALLLAGERDLRVMAADARTLPVHAHEYDIIFMLDLLSHRGVAGERGVLTEANRVLKPGGRLLVTVPAYSLLRSPHDRVLGITRRYRKKDIVALIQSAGFVVERATYLYWLFWPLALIGRTIERILGLERIEFGAAPAWLQGLLLRLHLFEAKLLGYIELPWGSSIMIRAKKPTQTRDPRGSHPLREI